MAGKPEASVGRAPAVERDGAAVDFIRAAILEDNRAGRFQQRVHTRFPPEPNGYLHIGHAKAICIDFGMAAEFGGKCNLRFDDTNPAKEEQEYVDNIIADVRWLGFDWEDRLFFASDYFGQMYAWAEDLIRKGKAYVCDLTAEQVSASRGTLTEPGKESPYRNRSVEENLDLFRRMRAGEFPDGAKTLRAKIDMAAPNLNLRDPVMYRILHTEHHRQGASWCIYPMYDWAHGLEDSIEGITHSLCSLEYENHRPLYDWFLEAPDRVRASQPDLPGDEQAQAAQAGAGGPRLGLGRSPHAYPQRAAAARLHSRSDPRLLRDHRHHQVRQHHRRGPARALPARRPQPARAALHGRAPSAQGRAGELPRGPGRVAGGGE
jgi:hypothetical protein